MKQRKEYMEELLERFQKGLTSETEEQVLSDFFCGESDVPQEWQVYQDIFMSFQTDAYDFSTQEMEAMLTSAPKKESRTVPLWTWPSAACVVAAAVAVCIVLLKPADPKVDVDEIEELAASVTNPGEQVENYDISMVDHGIVVTKTLTDGTTSSYLVSASAGNEKREIIPIAND